MIAGFVAQAGGYTTGLVQKPGQTAPIPLEQGVYLHRGAQPGTPDDLFIDVVGIAEASMAGANVLWLV